MSFRQGARQFFAARKATPPLPYDAEVEYLESTGTQYIDTGIIGGSASKVEIVAASANTTQNAGLFGSRNAANVKAYTIWQRVTNTSVRFDFTDNTANRAIANAAWDTSGVNTVVKDGPNNTLNGVAGANNSTATFSCEYSFFLFGISTAGALTNGFVGAVYSCKIWDGSGNLVRDLIPVRFTNELGQSEGAMFDRANPTVGINPDGSPRTDGLYRNRGTGAFLYGSAES